MGEKFFGAVGKIWVFLLPLCLLPLLTVQAYHIWRPEAQQMNVASRLNAEIKTDMEEIWIAAAREEKLFTYLTIQVDGGAAVDADIAIGGAVVANLRQGLVTIKVFSEDVLSVISNEGADFAVAIAGYPDILDEKALPRRLAVQFGGNDWGRVRFR